MCARRLILIKAFRNSTHRFALFGLVLRCSVRFPKRLRNGDLWHLLLQCLLAAFLAFAALLCTYLL
jgi:hypothetical protein